jgi:hypothetical protein
VRASVWYGADIDGAVEFVSQFAIVQPAARVDAARRALRTADARSAGRWGEASVQP